jgi:ADP-heptose:LPS heptosyltransferase
MQNKEWFVERFQSLVDALKSRFQFIQIGSAESAQLENTLDLRGKTSLRETAALLDQSRLFIGQVGFLMHLARAVECRSVILYGGRETPALTGYSANVNLYTPLPCSPCWQRSKCDFGRECMKQIGVETALAAVEKQLNQSGALPFARETL